MGLPSSALRQIIESMPDSWKTTKEQVTPYLLKRGVKKEELDAAGIEKLVQEYPEKRLNKSTMLMLEEQRADMHGKAESKAFSDIVLPSSNMDSYKVNIRRFTFTKESTDSGRRVPIGRRVNSHFKQVPDYMWHTRTTNEDIDGLATRVVQEIQSDLHQQGRLLGYTADEAAAKRLAEEEKRQALLIEREFLMDDPSSEAEKRFNEIQLKLLDYRHRQEKLVRREMQERKHLKSGLDLELSSPFPPSPYKKTWLPKALEQEVLDAAEEGLKAIAIPLQGAIEPLQRSKEVEKWYDTVVRSELKRLAKRIGGKYKETAKVVKDTSFLTDDLTHRKAELLFRFIETNRKELLQIPDFVATAGRGPQLEEINSFYATQWLRKNYGVVTNNVRLKFPNLKVTYGQIVLPDTPKQEVKNKLKLYSAGGIAGSMATQEGELKTDKNDMELFIQSWKAKRSVRKGTR